MSTTLGVQIAGSDLGRLEAGRDQLSEQRAIAPFDRRPPKRRNFGDIRA